MISGANLAALTRALPDHAPHAGYAMTFDADDIAHPGLVAEMLQGQAKGGYLVERGYVLDKGAGIIGRAAPRSLRQPLCKPFWKLCGSCAALRYDLANGTGEVDFLREMSQHEHRMFPYLAKLAGRDLRPFSRPMVTYLLNHGDNFGARRGRVGFKTRFVQRYRRHRPGRDRPDRDVSFALKLYTGAQPCCASRSLTLGPTAPKSICPVYCDLSSPMTLPMSRIELAPTCSTASSTALSTSLSLKLARQEFLDHANLVQFAFGKVQTPTLFIGARAFLTLLDHLAKNGQHIRFDQAGFPRPRRAARSRDP